MSVALVVFVVTTATIFAVYYFGIVRPEEATREALEKRLRAPELQRRSTRRLSLLRSTGDVSSLPLIDKLIAPYDRITRPITRNIEHADLKLTVGALLAVCAIAGLVTYIVTLMFFVYHTLAIGAAAIGAMLPIWFVRFKANQRISKFEETFPEAIDLISRALRAGHAFATALSMVAEEAPQPVGGEFKRLYDEQNFGKPFPQAMRDFAGRIPLIDAKFFVTAVLTQRESGGNLSEVLDNLGRVIRERFKVKRQIRVLSAHGRMTAGVLIALPPFLAACFMVMHPEHLGTMTDDPLGWWMIGGAAFLQAVGTYIIKKLINIEY